MNLGEKMKKLVILFVIIWVSSVLHAYELNRLIDSPTAGILQKGESEISAKIYKNNGLLIGAKVGLFPRFMFGVNYGAEQIVGNEEPIWHERVEFNAKLRLMDESFTYPAVAIGYDSQGHGNYIDEADSIKKINNTITSEPQKIKRYDIKSKGVYLVASKNWSFFGNFGTHLGINKTLESDDKDLNVFLGIDKTLGNILVLNCEYDFAWNDNEEVFLEQIEENYYQEVEIEGRGYLNSSLDIHFTEYLILKISFFDILHNNKVNASGSDRTLTLLYSMTF
jgi:hypothetical protein